MTVSRIIVGVDGSDVGAKAVAFAAELADGLSCPVLALHCFEPLSLLGKVKPPFDFPALKARAVTALQDEWCAPLAAAAVEFEARVVEGTPIDSLIEAAEAEPSPLVVVGARGLNALKGIVMGSTSEALIHRLKTPVVIVPA